MLKIGIDAFPLSQKDVAVREVKNGIATYLFYLLDELIRIRKEDQFFLYTYSSSGPIEHFSSYSNVQIRIFSFLSFSHSLWSQTALSFGVWLDEIDFFWGGTQSIPLFKRKKMKTILNLHDFTYLLYPKTMSLYKCLYFRIFSKWLLTAADVVVTNSFGTLKRLQQLYGIKGQEVIAPPIKPKIYYREKALVNAFLLEKKLTFDNYVVTVGTIEPRKNLILLIEIYKKILTSKQDKEIFPLLVIGERGWKDKNIVKALENAISEYPNQIQWLRDTSDSELAHYLSGAFYYISLSLYEGYGMPIAEARRCRTPIVCLDIPEMREAAEEDGIFLDEKNLETTLTSLISYNRLETENLEKSVLKTEYMTNQQNAEKLSRIFNHSFYIRME